METINNSISTQEIVDLIPNMKEKIEKTTKEYKNYKEVLKFEKFEEMPNEKEEETIKRGESIFDRLDEMVKRRELALKNGKETIELIEVMKNKIERIVESYEEDEIQLAEKNNEIINKIYNLEKKIIDKKIYEINFKFQEKMKDWNNQKMDLWKIKRKKEQEAKKLKQKEERKLNLISFEIQQIEEWTKLKCGKVIFDSDNDDWSRDTSVFDQIVLNKKNLIFVIEDTEGNKFGGYVSAQIDKINEYINDPNSFLFSLKSNGRILRYQQTQNKLNQNRLILPGSTAREDCFYSIPLGMSTFSPQQEREMDVMMKFEIKNVENAFCLENYSLFSFGYNQDAQVRGGPKCDIKVAKEGSGYNCCVQKTYYWNVPQISFDYKGIGNALCGKEEFNPKRITVIQLI